MKNYTKVNPMALKAIHAKQNKQDTKRAILFTALFIVPVIVAGLLEILNS